MNGCVIDAVGKQNKTCKSVKLAIKKMKPSTVTINRGKYNCRKVCLKKQFEKIHWCIDG